MRTLIIDEDTITKIEDLIDYARVNPFSMDDLLDIKNGTEPPAGDREGFKIFIPNGYRVIFCFEEQNAGLHKHISISVDDSKSLPSILAVGEIANLFGYDGPLTQNHVYIEGADGQHQSINILAKA